MTTSPKPRARKRAAAPARPEPDAPTVAPDPVLTLAEIRAQADELQAERSQIEAHRAQALAQVQECDDKLKAYDGALEICVRFIEKLKVRVEEPTT